MNEGYPDRIISKSEINNFEFLLNRQALDYPNYEKWVSNTIKQIESGDKIAFGIFVSSKDIVGSGVINITASDTVELKNFYISPEYRKKGLATQLLEYIENFCIERGYTQIHVDMSLNEQSTIMFFIKHDYKFQARGDFYGRGIESYLLIKKLPIKYVGDYDWKSISKWAMEKIFGYHLKHDFSEEASYYSKEIEIGDNSETERIELMATLYTRSNLKSDISKENIEIAIDKHSIKGSPFYFAPNFTDEAIGYAIKKGITLIDVEKLEKLSRFQLPRSEEDIAGLIVTVKPEYYEKLIVNKDRVFIRGKENPANVKENQVILFYVTEPVSSIKGYAKITKITVNNPVDIWQKYSRQSAFSDDEYETYTKNKSTVTAYSFDKIKEFPENISLNSIRSILGSFNHQSGQRISAEDKRHLFEVMKSHPSKS